MKQSEVQKSIEHWNSLSGKKSFDFIDFFKKARLKLKRDGLLMTLNGVYKYFRLKGFRGTPKRSWWQSRAIIEHMNLILSGNKNKLFWEYLKILIKNYV